MTLDDFLGIDINDPGQRLALVQVEQDNDLLDRLICERARRGLSQAELGERIGISQSAVARIESGDRDPRISTLGRYAHALGVLIRHSVDTSPTPALPLGRAAVTWDYVAEQGRTVRAPSSP